MKITIYKSKYNWIRTLEELSSHNYEPENDTTIIENEYYKFLDLTMEDEDNFKIIAKPLLKRKERKTLDWQLLLQRMVREEDSLENFMPPVSYTFDAIIVLKQLGVSEGSVYLIPFGQAYHNIDEVIDIDFGIDFAERTIRNDNVTIKNVSFFHQNRLKEITNYRRNNADFARPTESYASISGTPNDISRYGKTIHCSLGVSLNIPTEPKKFKDKLISLVIDIDELMLRGSIINTFPRLKVLKDKEKISILDALLLNSLINTDETDISIVDFSRLIEFQSHIILLDEMPSISLYIRGAKISSIKSIDQSEEDYISFVGRYLQENSIIDVNRVMLEIVDHNGDRDTIQLKRILHAEVNDNGTHYLLQNGYWGTYNDEFFDLLNNYLEEINVEQNSLSSKQITFESTEEKYMEELLNNEPECYEMLHKHFIKPINENFLVKGSGVELADLYNREENELITVKKGVKTSLSLYSLEQSMIAMNALNYMESYDFSDIEKVLTENEVKNLRKSNKNSLIWLLPIKNSDYNPIDNSQHTLNVQNKKFNLKQLGSVLLKNKLAEWALFSLENRLTPFIYMETPIDTKR
ncbi:DUF6119 family protein [Salinicoccus roseus]|uniref:DUF6119 family protein n=1 Tax=Salinicoccus roseus TaxID=45670 RepID=UPI001EF65F15|nr:DUF6119 family protein [Salinicoccus roseus]MCG7331863.1 TIGR04141 family sporadically distributed protein [Salinicoccus roseus]